MSADGHLDISVNIWHVKWTELQTETGGVVSITTDFNVIVEFFRREIPQEHTNISLGGLLHDLYSTEHFVRRTWPSFVHNPSKM